MKILLLNDNIENITIKYDLLSKIEKELDKQQKYIKLDYVIDNMLEKHLDSLQESYAEDDFDLYILMFYKDNDDEFYINYMKQTNIKEIDYKIIEPAIYITNINEILDFALN